ncbi:hypothetical protein [Halocatena halophila]|uniref:hypothetical protein n=1 Tax=Halocatena halophila TaxID=2814576 RepID=UPI002ED5A225
MRITGDVDVRRWVVFVITQLANAGNQLVAGIADHLAVRCSDRFPRDLQVCHRFASVRPTAMVS